MEQPRIHENEEGEACCSVTNSLLIVFFDIRGIVRQEFAPDGQTTNGEFYCHVLHHLREDIRRKRPELWRAGDWLLLMTMHPITELS
jgi:hypothetical protein